MGASLLALAKSVYYIGLFLFSNEGRGVSLVTDGIVDSVLMNLLDFFVTAG